MNIIVIENSGDHRIFFNIFRNIAISEMLPESFIEKFLTLDQWPFNGLVGEAPG